MQLYGFLRWARRIIALAVFTGLAYFFIAFSAKATALWSTLLGLQIVPGILGIATGGLVTVIIVLLLTLLFGRVYCSLLCPLGIYQDIIYRLGLFVRNKKKRRTRYAKPHNTLRYSILIIVVICVAFLCSAPGLAGSLWLVRENGHQYWQTVSLYHFRFKVRCLEPGGFPDFCGNSGSFDSYGIFQGKTLLQYHLSGWHIIGTDIPLFHVPCTNRPGILYALSALQYELQSILHRCRNTGN